MKTLLAFSFLFLASLVAHADTPADDHREDFEGYYKLRHATYGLCDDYLRVFNQGADNGGSLFVGGYFFAGINGGPTKTVSEVDVVTRQTTLKNHVMIFREHRVSKLADTNDLTINTVSLSPNLKVLTLKSTNQGSFNTITLCSYNRTKDPDDSGF